MDSAEAPGLWASFGTSLRLIVGWFCVVIGVVNLLTELDRKPGATDGPYLLFHATLLAGGLLLLALPGIGARPGVPGYAAGAVTLVAGTLLSAIPATRTVCCLRSFSSRHGFPYTFAARNDGGHWRLDSQHLLANLLFWGLAGLFLLLAVSLFRRRRHEHPRVEPG